MGIFSKLIGKAIGKSMEGSLKKSREAFINNDPELKKSMENVKKNVEAINKRSNELIEKNPEFADILKKIYKD